MDPSSDSLLLNDNDANEEHTKSESSVGNDKNNVGDDIVVDHTTDSLIATDDSELYYEPGLPMLDNNMGDTDHKISPMVDASNVVKSAHPNLDSSIMTRHKVHLHFLRNVKASETFEIKAHFTEHIKFPFTSSKPLNKTENNGPYIHSLELDVACDNRGRLSVLHKGNLKPVTEYRLKLSDFDDNEQKRVLLDPRRNSHIFLFDVHFKRGRLFSPPGSDVPFGSQLCLFTCFLLQHQTYDIFDELADQFKANLQDGKRQFSRDHLKEFFKECNNYVLYNLAKSTSKHIGIKLIVRMIGLLPIQQHNLELPDPPTEQFTAAIMDDLTKILNTVIISLTDGELVSFKDGIVTLLCIQLLSQRNNKANANRQSTSPLELLLNEPIEAQRLDIVRGVLKLLTDIGKSIPDSIWFELLTLDSPEHFTQRNTEACISFEAYLKCTTKVMPVLGRDMHFNDRLSRHFDYRVDHNQFSIDLESIVFLLKFLQIKPSDNVSHHLETIRSMIDSSIQLRDKIKEYMLKLNVTIERLNTIRDIFRLAVDSNILFHVKKKEFLLKSLASGYGSQSLDFYTQWFFAFMVPEKQQQSVLNNDEFKELLKDWTICFAHNRDLVVKMIKKIDLFLSAIGDHPCSAYFIQHMVDLCFQQKSIIDVIQDSLLVVYSQNFLNEFKAKYATEILIPSQNSLKQLTNSDNPLCALMTLDKQYKGKNAFVRDLIRVACDKIEIEADEMLQDIFYQPNNTTFTYMILFDDCFKTVPIRQRAVDRLLVQLLYWEEVGMRADELWTWEKYTNAQRKVADRVWKYIGQVSEKKFEIDKLIDTEHDKMQEKMKITDMIPSCLDIYCRNASDKQNCEKLLQDMANSFAAQIVRAVPVPTEIEQLVPLASRLDPYSKSNAWHTFREQHLTQPLLPTTTDGEEDLVAKLEDMPSPTTCFALLTQAVKIFDLFIARLKGICVEWKQLPISNWIHLFPDIRYVDHDLRIIEPLLDDAVVPFLKQILELWKGREHTIRVCQGIDSLLTHLKVAIDDDTRLVFDSVVKLDETASGDSCHTVYENYCANYSKRYSAQVLDLIAQYKASDELITFLHSLATTDVDNLLEAVNDWDETLINTKTILDLVLIKTFLDRAYANIEVVRQKRPPQCGLAEIVDCFENVRKDDEFKNILQCFESCSKSLSSIKRVYLELTNKEQSKRRRIFDIVQNASFGFIRQPVNTRGRVEHRFDVSIKEQTMCYADLGELCDRARLIEYSNNNTNKMKKDSEREIHELRLFVRLVSVIETVLTNLTSLNMAGHPSVSHYLAPHTEFKCIAGDYQKLTEFSSSLETLLADWENHLCAMYEQYIDLTYFSSQQIWMVEDYLYNQTSDSTNDAGYHLLKFIGIESELIATKFLPKKSEQAHERLKNIGRILSAQRSMPNVENEGEISTMNKVLLVETSHEGILRAILSLFKLIMVPARVNHLFYCTGNTSWVEIRAFAYRCFYSRATLHQLIRPELLSTLVQDQFTRLLRKLIKHEPKRLFRLGIITTASTAHLQFVNGLKALQIVDTIHDQDLLDRSDLQDMIRQLVSNTSKLVTSRIAGLGKSTFIRDDIQRLGKHYIKFPVNGNINVDTIAERLRNIAKQLSSPNAALHIDIGVVDNIQQLNELLYCLLLFRGFRLGQEVVHVPIDVPVYIELDSSPDSLGAHASIVVLQFLPSQHLEAMNWNELKVNDMMAIQLVVNYLQAINNQTISKRNIMKGNITQLDANTCISLLQEHFLQRKNKEFVTWTQLSIFTAVYESLFDGFSRCGHFIVEIMEEAHLRINILQTLLQSSDQFTSLSVESVRKNQRSTDDGPVAFSDAIVRWDKAQPFTVVFSDTDDPLFVYKNVDDVSPSLKGEFNTYNKALAECGQPQQNLLPDYSKLTHAQFFVKLVSLSKKYYRKSICPKCFTQYENTVQRCTNCSTNDILCQPHKSKSEDVDKIIERMGEKIKAEYVLTPDNYIKMLLIYLRVQSGLPVLIMGETGCGKTALIQFLCQKILDDEMAIFRIHAGITSEKILETMRLYADKARACSDIDAKRRLWVFLDEFNTTPSIGLLKEITCERTLLGEPLPKNLVILGACNPQRRKSPKVASDDDVGIKKDRYETQRLAHVVGGASLLYTVVPIPETMLEYVWDYGYLDKATETKYVRTMLNSCERLESDPSWFDKTAHLIGVSQQFFRDCEDVSSVSLRDVARFCRLYNWFLKSILIREGDQKLLNNRTDVLSRATLIALSLCYFFRLSGTVEREAYTNVIQESLNSDNHYIDKSLVEILRSEQEKLVKLMDLPSATATNRALTDNIFVLLACIINRIPVVLCGKPGCSKTSSVQIVISNLKGKKSKDPYFQTLPELIPVSYQGSQNCTSDSIFKVFERADKYLRAKSETELLPVIVFDEIGLAELSPHNPLKVLHSELEVETCRHGFVGLSNWRLDASKMNRALYLACPDPDVSDLQLTAKTILTSMISNQDQVARVDDSIIKSLAAAYFDLYEHIKTQPQYNNYFGLRDYYSLIKGVVRDLIQVKEGDDVYEKIRRQVTVNFDGSFDGSLYMWEHFCQHMNKMYLFDQYKVSPTFNQVLDQCLSSRTGRYLMLIGENESVIDYVERYIIVKFQPPPVRTLIGSCFPGDLIEGSAYSEQYNYRVLMDIILYAENPVTLVMRRMGHLYDNLYDLFNQSFAISGSKQYCRIPLGPLYHPRCLVHENFYCVVFVRQQDLAKCDPPFLNRFEKHVINMESLVHRRHWTITSSLHSWLTKLLPTNVNKHFPLLQHLFVDYSDDYICNLVIDACTHLNIAIDDGQDDNEDDTRAVIVYCKDILMRTSSFDLPLVMSLRSDDESQSLIQQYYDTHEHLSFSTFINRALEEKTITNQVIYTYTQLYHAIDSISNGDRVEEIKLGNFKTELELTNKIKEHYHSGHARILLIRVDYHQEHEHILLLKHILLNEHVNTSNRGVWLVFHLQRNMLNQITNDVLFNGWSSVMIDNLNDHKLIPRDILSNSSYLDFVTHPNFCVSERSLDDLISRCLTKIRYTVAHEQYKYEINARRNRIIESLTRPTVVNNDQDKTLRSIVEDRLSTLMHTIPFGHDGSYVADWRHHLLATGTIIGSCRSFLDALHATIVLFYDKYLLLLFAHLEQYSFIDAYSFLIETRNKNVHEHLHRIWFECLTSTLETIDRTIMNVDVVEILLVFNLRLPCAIIEYALIRQIRETMTQRHQNDDGVTRDELATLAMKQLNDKSVYKQNIEIILNNPDLFTHYYHDQVALAQDEAKIYQLPIVFVQRLLTSNPIRSVTDRLKHLLVDHAELFEVLRIFEIGVQLIGAKAFVNAFDQLSIQHYSPGETINGHNQFYTLVIVEHKSFCLIPPKAIMKNEENFVFECDGDPWIETNLMNLIELLVSPSITDHIDNIEQLTTAYNLIAQGILTLNAYTVNNLEKLRSFASLVRCITALTPSNEQAKHIFQNACRYAGFDATFSNCDAIHEFIDYLRTNIADNELTGSDTSIHRHRALLKLEMDFLKNWLADNSDRYDEILILMSQPKNNLWQYSAKIFTYIDQELDLLSTIKSNNGQLAQTDKKYDSLDQCLLNVNDTTQKIERLMVNRIHMQLMLDANRQGTVEEILTKNFTQFEENMRQLQVEQAEHGSTLVSLIAWTKYYAELYAVALNNASQYEIMETIDQLLTRDESPFSSTVKLFVIKQICQIRKLRLDDVRGLFANRNLVWIRSMFEQSIGQQTNEPQHNLILPVPLVVCRDEFVRISTILTHNTNIDHLRQLIRHCATNQTSLYCFIVWFIHYYSRFYTTNGMQTNDKWDQLITGELGQELRACFEPIGHKLLVSLCTNFSNNSYFRLQPTMTMGAVNQRLVVLNIAAFLLSLKSLGYTTYLGSLLLDENLKMPNDYPKRLETSICLPGLLTGDVVITQMRDMRMRVQERLDTGELQNPNGKFVYKCSDACLWMYHFEDCGEPVGRAKCSLCKKDIGAQSPHVLLDRNPPQIKMTIDAGFQFIANYINKYNEQTRFGYHNITLAEQSNAGEKSEHLNRPVSFRFIHMLTHAVLLLLHELDFLTNSNLPNREHFRQHFEKDYALLGQQSGDPENCHVWLFKLINHMLDDTFLLKGVLNENQKVIELEKLIEERLIFAHIDSVPTEINEYKRLYAEYWQKQDEDSPLENFVDELFENENHYPLLSFFNVTDIYTTNPIEKFRVKLQAIPYGNKIYPMTTFLMERLTKYVNIQHLYPIVTFTNYLFHKFNHRIKRNDAAETSIDHYLTNGSDCEQMSNLYQSFVNAWYKLTLKEVRFGCQTARLEHVQVQDDFAKNTMIAVVLLNASKDESSILLAACLRTMGQLQNEIVNYFHNTIGTDPTGSRRRERAVPIQAVRPEHLFCLDADDISAKLVTDGFTINYEYGKSRDIIYDYEEIELTLRNTISRLPLIDTEKLQFLNYQFELHGENASLITDVRARVKQEPLVATERTKLKGLIHGMDNDDIVHYLGSLDYVFTYLRNIDMNANAEAPTIQTFVEQNIRWTSCLNDNVHRRPPFSTVHLKHIIDLYELLEECAFDQVLRNYVKQEWCEEAFPSVERTRLVERFIAMTFGKQTIAVCLQNIDCWIGILKRVMIRVLSNVNVSADVPLQFYLERNDLWTGNVTEADTTTFEVDEEILLQHTFVILKGLEKKQKKSPTDDVEVDVEQQCVRKTEVQSVDTQTLKAAPWNSNTKSTSTLTKVIGSGDKKKRRV